VFLDSAISGRETTKIQTKTHLKKEIDRRRVYSLIGYLMITDGWNGFTIAKTGRILTVIELI